tara:strand:- start:159 stop:1346 length:1188 start_codon:yes stop_codon:yes gene_type:complete
MAGFGNFGVFDGTSGIVCVKAEGGTVGATSSPTEGTWETIALGTFSTAIQNWDLAHTAAKVTESAARLRVVPRTPLGGALAGPLASSLASWELEVPMIGLGTGGFDDDTSIPRVLHQILSTCGIVTNNGTSVVWNPRAHVGQYVGQTATNGADVVARSFSMLYADGVTFDESSTPADVEYVMRITRLTGCRVGKVTIEMPVAGVCMFKIAGLGVNTEISTYPADEAAIDDATLALHDWEGASGADTVTMNGAASTIEMRTTGGTQSMYLSNLTIDIDFGAEHIMADAAASGVVAVGNSYPTITGSMDPVLTPQTDYNWWNHLHDQTAANDWAAFAMTPIFPAGRNDDEGYSWDVSMPYMQFTGEPTQDKTQRLSASFEATRGDDVTNEPLTLTLD